MIIFDKCIIYISIAVVLQSCKLRYVSLSEAAYLNRNTVLRCCRLLCCKMCIYDFNWLYSLFCVIFDFIITFKICCPSLCFEMEICICKCIYSSV